MGDEFAKAKDALLASGLPLEHSVEKRLGHLGFHATGGDFSYWRRSNGEHRDFSVDLALSGGLLSGRLTRPEEGENPSTVVGVAVKWELLVECKYRRPNVRWLFAPSPRTTNGVCRDFHRVHLCMNGRGTHPFLTSASGFGHIGPGTPASRIGSSWCQSAHPEGWHAAVAMRGVEMRKGDEESADAFSTPIRRGVSQLQYGLVPRCREAILDIFQSQRESTYHEASASVFTPILVTTAELWLFRDDVDLDAVKNADSLEGIAHRVQEVEYSTATSSELRAHHAEWLRAIKEGLPAPLNEEEWGKRDEAWRRTALQLESESTSVLIVDYSSIGDVIQRHRSVLSANVQHLATRVAEEEGFTQFGPWPPE